MATVIRQTMIWGELERELPPGLEEVAEFLHALSQFDDDIVRELERERGHGRDDHPVRAMWNLLATGLYLRHGRFSEVLAELSRNSDLARLLGFDEIGPNLYKIPSDSAVSRFHVKLNNDVYLEKVNEVLKRSVAALAAENPEFGKHTALDASDVRTHARPPRKAAQAEQSNNDGAPPQEPSQENDKEQEEHTSSDPEASWSVKTKTWEDGQGKKRKETKSTYGYKYYAVSDSTVPAVVAVDVQTGKTSDQNMAMPMVDAARENLPNDRMKTVAMDKGFDSEQNVRGAFSRDVAAVVPVREVPENLDKLPKADREEPLSPGSNVVYDRYTGEVACYETSASESEPTRRTVTYAGFESDRSAHKFRCPLGPLAATQCTAFDSCAAGPAGSQGRQVRISLETDYRRFAPIYPRSKRWKRLYNGRSAVERINSYVKDVLQLERHAVRGQKAIKLRALLASITLNVRTLISLRRQAAVTSEAA
jgi:hypothetical protein